MKNITAALLILVLIVVAGCTATEKGAVIGGAVGAGTGALIGHEAGSTGTGALIGGVVGVVGGALIGHAIEEDEEEEEVK